MSERASPHQWTESQLAMLHTKVAEKATDAEIGAAVGLSREQARHMRRKLYGRKETTSGAPWYAQARQLYESGKTDEQIGEAVGRKPATIQKWRVDLKLPMNKPADAPPRAPRRRRSTNGPPRPRRPREWPEVDRRGFLGGFAAATAAAGLSPEQARFEDDPAADRIGRVVWIDPRPRAAGYRSASSSLLS